MGKLPTIRDIQLKGISFPHFEFECLEMEANQLVAPTLGLDLRIAAEGNRYAVEVKFKSNAEETASFRALVVARMEFVVTVDPSPPTEQVIEFLRVNSPVLVWPYLRELVSSATTRMGFPTLLLPMLDVSQMYFEGTEINEPEGGPTEENSIA